MNRLSMHFFDLCRVKQPPFGVHSPLLRDGSKYDLLEKVSIEPFFHAELFIRG